MATLPLINPSSTRALTEDRFASRGEYPETNSAALTEPSEQAFTLASKASTYRVVVIRNTAAPTSEHPVPNWVKPTITAYIGIQNLTDNWDSYGSKAINRDLIRQSLIVLGMVMQPNSPAPSVVPIGDGGLQIEWHRRQQDLEIVFAADEGPQFFHYNRVTGVPDEGLASETEKLISLIKDLA